MGSIIETRTWGGLVGVPMVWELLGCSMLIAPDYRIYNEQSKWVVENKGVEPDIIVEQNFPDLPKEYDTQLMKGVEVLLQKIKENPVEMPNQLPFPVNK